jgi:hypothetical protein
MIKKGASGRGQLDAMDAAAHQQRADFVFQIADLAAERRLRRVQAFGGCTGQASFLRNRNEKTKMP